MIRAKRKPDYSRFFSFSTQNKRNGPIVSRAFRESLTGEKRVPAHPGAGAAGSLNEKVLPRPGSL
jgi:hypothetical protein